MSQYIYIHKFTFHLFIVHGYYSIFVCHEGLVAYHILTTFHVIDYPVALTTFL